MLHSYAIDGEDCYVIETPETFDSNSWHSFREAYVGIAASRYRIDMRRTTHVDSSALAMLIMLRDHVGGLAEHIELVNLTAPVAYAIRTACFDRLFAVEYGGEDVGRIA